MTNIPFPNPHDADALNDYLDSLAAGTQANPESDVETAAREFHQLASRAEVKPETQQSIESTRGEETMHTATLAAPVSNRTRRQMAAAGKKPGRLYGWLSAVIVAGLIISMIGAAWLNREPGNPHDQLAFAPGTAEAATFVCPVTLPNNIDAPDGLDHYAADGHTWFEDGIWISIPTDGVLKIGPDQQNTNPESDNYGWGFEKLIVLRGEEVSGMVDISGQRLDLESELTPYNDKTVDQYYGETGFVPIALMIPGEGCWEFTATAGDASATWVLDVRFTNEQAIPWTQPISFTECPDDAELNRYDPDNPAGTLYTQEDYDHVSTERSYEIVGLADQDDAIAVATVMRERQACALRNGWIHAWSARFEWENRTTDGRISIGLIEDERQEASLSISDWLQSEQGLTPIDMLVEQDPADLELDGTESLQPHFLYDPAHAILFADGRIGIFGSIVYFEGLPPDADYSNPPYYAPVMSFYVYQDGEWLLDENLPICIGDCSELPEGTPMTGFDPYATPKPTSEPVEPTPTHVPRGGDNRG